MGINLGLYDVFANIVPGLLYSFFLFELTKLFNIKIPYVEQSSLVTITGLIVISFVLGHIFNRPSYNLWYRIIEKYQKSRIIALQDLRKFNPSINYDFLPEEAETLFAIIRHHDIQLAEKIDAFRANCIMLRNISFGFLLLAIVPIVYLVRDGFSWEYLIYLLGSVLFSLLAARRAIDYIRWFYREIFHDARNYGTNLSEVLKISISKTKAKVGK